MSSKAQLSSRDSPINMLYLDGGDMQGKNKTYPCPECGKIFNAHYNLTRHMPVHTGRQILNIFILNILFILFIQDAVARIKDFRGPLISGVSK
jgi:hypothetical protein